MIQRENILMGVNPNYFPTCLSSFEIPKGNQRNVNIYLKNTLGVVFGTLSGIDEGIRREDESCSHGGGTETHGDVECF